MLQNIRKNLQGTIAKVIVAIIVVPFALFGIESLLGGGGVQYAAEVNGEGIGVVELQQQINQQKRRLMSSMGDNIDPSMLDDQLLAGPALEFMIQKELLMQAADDYGLAVSDARLGEFIGGMEVFQREGQFNQVMYRQILSDQGYTPAGFQQALREDLIMTQLRAGLASSEFVTSGEVAQMAALQDEQRDIRYMVLPLEAFRDEAVISEEDIQSWYDENQSRFVTKETVSLEYIELRLEDYRQPVAEDRLREAFELEKVNFQLQEQRRVSHILFEQAEDESEEQVQTRVVAAQEQLAAGQTFDVVASGMSDDVGSASFGGDIGYTGGDAFPEEMELVIAALELNQVSEPVTSDAGVHLLLVTEIRAGESAGFEEVRAELEARISEEEARLALVKSVEDLRDLVFNAEDLAGPAAELELVVAQSEQISRTETEGLFANPQLIAAAFSTEVVNDGYNSEVIELNGEQFVVLRALEHKPSVARPLLEVRAQVERALADQKARETIREQASTLLARLGEGASVEELALENDYQWQVELAARRDNRSLPPSLVRRAFQLPAPADEGSTFEFVQNAEGDIELFELVRVTAGSADNLSEAQRVQLRLRLREEQGQQTDSYYQQALQAEAKIVRSS